MNQLNASIEDLWMPDRIKRLPISPKGFPVPFFVAWVDGKPDFRTADGEKLVQCVKRNLCWVCGQPLGQYKAFPIGPMCVINRNISEPPSHKECAEYSVRACPFLVNPATKRNEKNVPDAAVEPGGIAIKRNPGVTCIWVTKDFRVRRDGNGVLFRLGDPISTDWYSHGRRATRAEVEESIRTGIPILMEMAVEDGGMAVAMLKSQIVKSNLYLPKE